MSTKMNPEIKAKWVAALRSGEYQQGRANLRNRAEEFCCLGVLCDLAAKEGLGSWDADRRDDAYVWPNQEANLGYDVTLFPVGIKKWAGLGVVDGGLGPQVIVNGSLQALAIHNDDGRSFAQIADAIEEQL